MSEAGAQNVKGNINISFVAIGGESQHMRQVRLLGCPDMYHVPHTHAPEANVG